jgi:hypothetical protein
LAFVRFYLMYLFIVFCYAHHYKTFATATSNTIGGHLGKGKNVQVGIKAVYLRARTDYANRACNVTCNVMLVAKLVPRTADEPSAQRTASILRLLIDRTAFHRHRDECLCCKKSNSAHNICLSLIHTRRINNSTSFRFTAVILLTTSYA